MTRSAQSLSPGMVLAALTVVACGRHPEGPPPAGAGMPTADAAVGKADAMPRPLPPSMADASTGISGGTDTAVAADVRRDRPSPDATAGGDSQAGTAGGTAQIDVPCSDVPPDPDVAAGPDLVGVANQGTIFFYGKNGTLDHRYMLKPPEGRSLGDTHISYDLSSGRWFISEIASGVGGTGFGVALFASSDATAQSWKISLPIRVPALIDDPIITVTGDKVVVSEHGSRLWVMDKAAVIDGTVANVMPAASNIASNDQVYGVKHGPVVPSTAYLVTMADATHVNWITVDGTPATNDVMVRQHQVAVPAVNALPVFGYVTQQGGSMLESGGVEAMWQADHLYWSKSIRCGAVSCIHVFDVDTATNTVDSFDLGMPGRYLFWGVPGVDGRGNVWVLMSEVTATTAPGLALGGRMAAGDVVPPTVILEGTAPHNGNRFGDYYGMAQDPVDGTLWGIGEYGGAGGRGVCRVVHVVGKPTP
jgi:hypothetical protein